MTVTCHKHRVATDLLCNRAHVVQDIIPYTCVIDDCDTPDEMYLTTEALMAHTLDKHSLERWTCDYCASSTDVNEVSTSPELRAFETAKDWIDHIAKDHRDAMSPDAGTILADLNKRQMILPLSCPLCPFSVDYMDTRINDHILLHLHEFSLLALPEDAWGSGEKTTGTVSQASERLSYTLEIEELSKPDLEYGEIAWLDLHRYWQMCLSEVKKAARPNKSQLSNTMNHIHIPTDHGVKSSPMIAELSASLSRRIFEIILAIEEELMQPTIDIDAETTDTLTQLVQEVETVVNAMIAQNTPQEELYEGRHISAVSSHFLLIVLVGRR